jgi:uncharacterized protein YraI
MKRLLGLAAAVLFLALPCAGNAQVAEGYLNASVTMRAGPSPEYPPIVYLPYDTWVSVQGCLNGWEWCDVIANGNRGWVPGNYILYDYQGGPVLLPSYGARIGIPIVAFSIGLYWGAHYSHRNFYRDRNRWYHRPPPIGRPPAPPHRPSGGWARPPRPPMGGHRPPNANRPRPPSHTKPARPPVHGHRPPATGARPRPMPPAQGQKPPSHGNRPPQHAAPNRPPVGNVARPRPTGAPRPQPAQRPAKAPPQHKHKKPPPSSGG